MKNKVLFFLNWLLVSRFKSNKKRSWKETTLSTLFVLVITLPVSFESTFFKITTLPNDVHSLISFEMALNSLVCKKSSSISTEYPIRFLIRENEKLLNTSVLKLPSIVSKTDQTYCDSLHPHINNENSLMYLDLLILKLYPNISVDGLIKMLVTLRILVLAFFIFVCMRLGLSPLFSSILYIIGIYVQSLINQTHVFALYPFLMSFVIALVSVIALLMELNKSGYLLRTISSCVLVGLLGAFFFNFRTSYLPFILLSFFSYAVYSSMALLNANFKSKIILLLISSILFLSVFIGFSTFQHFYYHPIAKLFEDKVHFNRAYHVVGHPLVLGLSIPENSLSQREGIKWDDSVGESLAKKIDIEARYLDKKYERAMLTYYAKLWIYYPEEMIDVYWKKWKLSVTGSLGIMQHFLSYDEKLGISRRTIFNILTFPMQFISNGFLYTMIFLISAFFFITKRFTLNPSARLSFALLSMAAFLISLESVIISPVFYLQYHNALLFIIFFHIVVFYQLSIDFIAGRIMWFKRT